MVGIPDFRTEKARVFSHVVTTSGSGAVNGSMLTHFVWQQELETYLNQQKMQNYLLVQKLANDKRER
jgi:hypothetical protein